MKQGRSKSETGQTIDICLVLKKKKKIVLGLKVRE